MRHIRTLFTFALALLFGALQAQTVYTAHLTGRHEVQPVASTGYGEITATLTGNVLAVSGFFKNLTGNYDATVAGGAHLHLGYAGQTGGILFTLTPTLDADLKGGTFSTLMNTFTLSPEQMAFLQERRIYVNIHTTSFASGELRGQLVPQADHYRVCNLFGSNHLPTVESQGSGALMLEITGNQLVVTGSFANLSGDFASNIAGGAHLHFGLPGTSGGIAVALNATVDAGLRSGVFEAANNTFTLTADQLNAIIGREAYANIHTTTHTSGELRGQVTGIAQAVFRGRLSGAQEWPTVATQADGMVQAELFKDTLIVSGAFGNLKSQVATDIAGGAHVHIGLPGASGAVALALNASLDADLRGGTFEPAMNTFVLTAEQVEALMQRACYVNIHSKDAPAGEIRSQLLLEAQAHFTAFLNGVQEQPDVNSTGYGVVMAELSGDRLTCVGSFAELESAVNVAIAGGAHIHMAVAGRSGDVVTPLTLSLEPSLTAGAFLASQNSFALTAEQKEALFDRGLYINIHTLLNAGGEIRGNLLGDANLYFLCPMSGASQPVAVNSTGNGMLIVEVNGNQATASGSFNELSTNFDASIAGGAHLHTGMAGGNGGIAVFLNTMADADLKGGVFPADSNRFEVDAGLLDTLLLRGIYANIHTMGHASGEIRGQCLPVAGSLFHATLSGLSEANPVSTDATGTLKFELSGSTLICSGSFAMLDGQFDANIAGGVHLHLGGIGENGDIALTLHPELSADLKSGVFLPDSNTFDLTAEQVAALRLGASYINLHTTSFASGELRGQVLHEINLFPSASDIVLPPAGTMIMLEGAASTLLNLECMPASDPDGDDINYIWQLALDADFNQVIYMQPTGGLNIFTVNYGQLDAALEAAGISVGSQVTLYHRMVVTDGCNATPGNSNDAQFARGNVVATSDVLASKMEMTVSPNVFQNTQPTLRIDSKEALDGELMVFDQYGRILMKENIALTKGNFSLRLDLDNLAPGTYYVSFHSAGRWYPPVRLVKQ